MAQEFTIKSKDIEDKINQLLPSQGGYQAGVDFSASTMVIPVVDLTETAEGSSLRQDLQTALSLTSATTFNVTDTSTTIINTTGYYRMTGMLYLTSNSVGDNVLIQITDGVTTKDVLRLQAGSSSAIRDAILPFDLTVFLGAGDSLIVNSSSTATRGAGSVRQVADINGNLINP